MAEPSPLFANPILRSGMFALAQAAPATFDAAASSDAAERVRQDVRVQDGASMAHSLVAASEANAIRAVTDSPELLALADDDLQKVIEEADAHWRAEARRIEVPPQAVAIYPRLMQAAAETRLKRLAQVRLPEQSDARAGHDRRRAAWIGILARCHIAHAQSLLLFPATEAAWKTFVQANLLARALPDLGQLRLPELLAACYGAQLAADLAGQTALRDRARQEFNDLRHIPGREQEADEAARRVTVAFDEILQSLRARQARPAEEPAPLRPEDFPGEYNVYYALVLKSHATSVSLRLWDYDTAFAKLLQRVEPARLTPADIDMVAVAHQALRQRNLDEAQALHQMNYDVSLRIDAPDVVPCRVKCLLMLGDVHVARFRSGNTDPEGPRHAKAAFEQALALDAGSSDAARGNRAHALSQLVLCHRALGEFEDARRRAQEAIALLEPIDAGSLTLASAHGNLGDALEMLGHLEEGLREHLVAFRLFLRARDQRGIRTALTMISRLAPKIGKADEAVTAYQEGADASIEAADFDVAIDCLLGVARHAYTLRRFEEAFTALHRAEELTRGAQGANAESPDMLRRRHAIMSWAGTIGIMRLAIAPNDPGTFEQALGTIEGARRLAIDLQDDELVAGSWFQRAQLMLEAGRLDEAEQCCDTAQLLQIPSSLVHRFFALYARVRTRQARFEDAIVEYTAAIEDCGDQDALFRASYLHGIGECHESLGRPTQAVEAYAAAAAIMDTSRGKLLEQSRVDFVGHSSATLERLIILTADPSSDAFDAVAALHWMEQAKSRTFSEMLGQTPVALHSDAATAESLRSEESSLLQRVHTLRLTLMSGPPDGSQMLTLQGELDELDRRLDAIYGAMAASDPEYVALRRGETIAWHEVSALLASSSVP